MAVVMLLGAGSSFGSVGVTPHVPPLGNGLFTDLVQRGGVASLLPDYIKKLFESNFEDGMAEYYKYSDGNIMTFQRELAHYLSSFQPTDSNVYINLINELGSQRVIYSSLNYDLLFELSAGKLGLFTNYTSEYKKGGVRLLKIHGSSNFWPDLPTGMLQGCTIAGSGRADIQASIRPLNQLETLEKCIKEDSVAPAIAMFAVGKSVKISPDYVEQQYEMWKAQVLKSSKIFVIGVRVHEVDHHIWGVLGKAQAKVVYFGFESDRAEFEQWKTNNNKKNAYFYKSDFKNSVKTIKNMSKI
jgi:hypothetical protein